jgi:membrane glycosyltransferase
VCVCVCVCSVDCLFFALTRAVFVCDERAKSRTVIDPFSLTLTCLFSSKFMCVMMCVLESCMERNDDMSAPVCVCV